MEQAHTDPFGGGGGHARVTGRWDTAELSVIASAVERLSIVVCAWHYLPEDRVQLVIRLPLTPVARRRLLQLTRDGVRRARSS